MICFRWRRRMISMSSTGADEALGTDLRSAVLIA
jgi:hypothetical protein